MKEKSTKFEEVGRTKCVMCGRGNYQTTTIKNAVYDAYCVACRGLYRLFTRTRGMSDREAREKLFVQPPNKRKPYKEPMATDTGRMSAKHPNMSAKPSEEWHQFRNPRLKEGLEALQLLSALGTALRGF